MTPVRVLVVRVGAMGDVLHALPAVTALRLAKPTWEIGWAIDRRWAGLLGSGESRPVVDTVHVAATRDWAERPVSLRTLQQIRELRAELQSVSYDVCVDLQGTIRSAVIGRLAGAKAFAGYADPRGRACRMDVRETPRERGSACGRTGMRAAGRGDRGCAADTGPRGAAGRRGGRDLVRRGAGGGGEVLRPGTDGGVGSEDVAGGPVRSSGAGVGAERLGGAGECDGGGGPCGSRGGRGQRRPGAGGAVDAGADDGSAAEGEPGDRGGYGAAAPGGQRWDGRW